MATTEGQHAGLATLEAVQDRVLWLATSIIHHANKVRATPSGVKVGGHQASSASMVSHHDGAVVRASARLPIASSVKPHASPVLHAIEYLLGQLDASYLTTLREFGGLQSYPSRAQGPGTRRTSRPARSGIGATAPIWSAIAHRYVAGHFEVPQGGRQVALLGDAELDEGAIWEAVVDPMVPRLGEVLWVVDLNRQSLDRIVPDIAAGRIASMFEAAGWQTIDVKYGRRLRELFERDGGAALRRRIDEMPNEEYQRLLRSAPGELRERLPGAGRGSRDVARLVGELDDEELLRGDPRPRRPRPRRPARRLRRRPTRSPTGRPSSSPTRSRPGGWRPRAIRPTTRRCSPRPSGTSSPSRLGADAGDPWARFAEGSAEAELCAATRPSACAARPSRTRDRAAGARRTSGARTRARPRPSRPSAASSSTSSHTAPEVAARVVTVSPDVASSTNLGGWINRVGIWHLGDRIDWFADDTDTLVRWRESEPRPAHRARDRRGEPRRAARRARRDVVAGRAGRCCRSGRSTTPSSTARSSRGRSACTPAASRSSSGRRRA